MHSPVERDTELAWIGAIICALEHMILGRDGAIGFSRAATSNLSSAAKIAAKTVGMGQGEPS